MRSPSQAEKFPQRKVLDLRENGFSIVETLIAMAILAIVSFGFMGWVNMSYKNLDNMNENNEIANTMTRLKAAFGDGDAACTAMLSGRAFGAAIPYIPYYDVANQKAFPATDPAHHVLNTSYSTGINGVGLKVASIMLERFADVGDYYPPKVQAVKPGPRVIIANLVVRFEKTQKSGIDIVRKVPLFTLYGPAPATLVRCSPSPISEASTSLRSCSLTKDGKGYVDVDTTKTPPVVTCVNYPSLKWFKGHSSKTASCSQGVIAAKIPPQGSGIASQGAKFACRVTTAPGLTIPPRYYSGGLVDDGSSTPAMMVISGGACTFDYQAGSNSASFRGEVLCDTSP